MAETHHGAPREIFGGMVGFTHPTLTFACEAGGMPNYRRLRVPGGTYFFTVNLAHRGGDLLVREIATLRRAYRDTARELPFRTEAIVILPDHLHAVWTLPEGDADFSERWRRIKGRLSRSVDERPRVSLSKARKGEVGVWQRRFWERCLRNETELSAAIHYIHQNPVKHGVVTRAEDWPFSSIRRVGETHQPDRPGARD